MALNLTQALAELASLTQSGSATSAALLNLVHQVSVDAEGAVTESDKGPGSHCFE